MQRPQHDRRTRGAHPVARACARAASASNQTQARTSVLARCNPRDALAQPALSADKSPDAS